MVARMAQTGSAGASEQREVERVNGSFSLSRAVAAVANGRNLEGAEAEWASEASKEARSHRACRWLDRLQFLQSLCVQVLTTSKQEAGEAGAGFVPTVVPAAIEALRAPTVLEGLGTTVIRNATGNLQFPRVSTKATGTGATEVAADSDSGLDMDQAHLNSATCCSKN